MPKGMEDVYKVIGKNSLYAIAAIIIIAIIYSISPKVGIALTILIVIVGIANIDKFKAADISDLMK